jgi:hypothetical protein
MNAFETAIKAPAGQQGERIKKDRELVSTADCMACLLVQITCHSQIHEATDGIVTDKPMVTSYERRVQS